MFARGTPTDLLFTEMIQDLFITIFLFFATPDVALRWLLLWAPSPLPWKVFQFRRLATLPIPSDLAHSHPVLRAAAGARQSREY
jgi:hypothetical protein